jgi:transcriptional regulator GlxA family with amidase domain
VLGKPPFAAQILTMHRVAIVACDGVVPFDLSVPCEVFGRVRLSGGEAGYQVRVCGVRREVDAGTFTIKTRHGLSALAQAHTIIIPGVQDIAAPIPARLVKAIRSAAKRGTRIASVCSGAFILAATGLLDGRRMTTHWLATDELARRHAKVDVDPNALYLDCGQFLSSAGAAAGLDLCLYLVRLDYGAAVAADAARLSVMALERDGGQAQFIVHAPPLDDGASLASLLPWLEKRCADSLSLAAIARRAGMSVRSLNRHFREQVGTTPLRWLLRARVRRAQSLLETTPLAVELIATKVGFGSPSAFREQFQRSLGTSPLAYRRAFRSPSGSLEQTRALGRSSAA